MILVSALHERHYRTQARLAGIGFHAHEDFALFDRGAREHIVTGRALDGKWLAGKRCLIDHRETRFDDTIDDDGHARPHGDEVALAKVGNAHLHLDIALDELRRVSDVHESINERALRTGLGVFLHRFAELEQEHGLTGGFRVELRERQSDGRRVEHRHVESSPRQRTACSSCEREEAGDAKNHGDGLR